MALLLLSIIILLAVVLVMVFMNIFRQLVRRFSVPIMKSIYNAYQATIKRGAGAGTGPNNNRTQDTFGNYFSGLMSKANLGTSPMTESTAFKILNIEAASLKEADPKVILERYFTLLDKNDPAAGGTIYLQAKIICAKEFLL
jgi:hypothetical protein